MTEKTIYFSHGDKGGVGKSVASMVLIDVLLSARKGGIAILEGDTSQPDVAERFADVDGIAIGAVNLNLAGNTELAIGKMGDWIERSRADRIVVNLPAGAGDTLDEMSPVVAEIHGALGFRSMCFYSTGPTSGSTASLKRSLENGLASVCDRTIIVYPAFLGEPGKFHVASDPISSGLPAIIIPEMRPVPLRDVVLALPGAPSDLLDIKSPLTFTERAILRQWLSRAHAALAPVFETAKNEGVVA